MKNNFDLKKFLVENKLTTNSKNERLLKEGFSLEDFKDYVLDPEMEYEETFPFIGNYTIESLYNAFQVAYELKGYDVDEFFEAISDESIPTKVFRLLKNK